MKTLKTWAFAILCCGVIHATAQNRSPVPQQRTDYIKQHVSGISADQESKILAIEQSCSIAMQNMHMTKDKSASDSIRRSTDSHIKAVLTPDQYSQYKKIKKDLPKDDGKME